MTIANLPNFATFNGSGSTGPFLFAFPFLDDSQISVEKTVAGVTTALTPNVDFTVSGAGSSSGGSVTLTVALAVGSTLTVTRTMPIEQATSLPNQGPFFATTVEAAFDYLTMICQQLQAQITLNPFLGLGVLLTDPDTTGWGAAQAGATWFDVSSGNFKGWNGIQIVLLG